MADLLARRGYAAESAQSALDAAWATAVGPVMAAKSRPGALRRGVLAVYVVHSAIVQELNFRQTEITNELRRLAPDAGVESLRFRVDASASSDRDRST